MYAQSVLRKTHMVNRCSTRLSYTSTYIPLQELCATKTTNITITHVIMDEVLVSRLCEPACVQKISQSSI